ncbi:MAG: RNA recognition motif domain-containing protein [Armatimonadota bacterium]
MATKSLYVGNLPYTVTEDELREYFGQWGPVSEVRIVQGRGFGFVDVPAENAADAIEQTNGKDFKGRSLNVSEAKPKTEGGSRGGYGGGGGGRSGGYGGGGGGGYGGGRSSGGTGGGGGGGRRERW